MENPLQNITVLVADDAPINLMIMTQVLKNAGAEVFTAANGRQVLQQLAERPAHIILMDLQMPELDGFETTVIIRNSGQAYSNIPIVAVTAETAAEEIKKTEEVGMDGFISKPFVPQAICEKILTLLHSRQVVATVSEPEKAQTLPPDFDLTYLKEITNGQTDKLVMIVDNLTENAPLLLQQAIAESQMGNWAGTAALLHKLKGLIGLFFMPTVTEALLTAEAVAKSPNAIDRPKFNEAINLVSAKLPTIINLISNEMKK